MFDLEPVNSKDTALNNSLNSSQTLYTRRTVQKIILNLFFVQHVGDSASIVKDFASGTSSHEVMKRLQQAKRPVVILGADQLKSEEGPALLAYTQELAHKLQENLQDKEWKVRVQRLG